MRHASCSTNHRSWRTLAECRWPRAEWVAGHGPYAVLAHCGVLTVELHDTRESAERAKAAIDEYACGHRCHRDHAIVELGTPR